MHTRLGCLHSLPHDILAGCAGKPCLDCSRLERSQLRGRGALIKHPKLWAVNVCLTTVTTAWMRPQRQREHKAVVTVFHCSDLDYVLKTAFESPQRQPSTETERQASSLPLSHFFAPARFECPLRSLSVLCDLIPWSPVGTCRLPCYVRATSKEVEVHWPSSFSL